MSEIFEVIQEDDGQYVVMGDNGIIGGRWRSKRSAEQYAKNLSEGKINADELVFPVDETDYVTQQELVEQSGVRLWLKNNVFDREHVSPRLFKIVSITATGFAVLALIFALAFFGLASDNTHKDRATELEEQAVELQDEINDLNNELKGCAVNVETAWRAWDRRNDIWIRAVDALANGNVDSSVAELEEDNEKKDEEFDWSTDCAPEMDEDMIFASQQ